jgi:ABC-type Na+ efflux pump permease subunit
MASEIRIVLTLVGTRRFTPPMSFLPILARELRVASRRTATYRSRFMVALAAGLLITMLLLVNSLSSGASTLGQPLFMLLSVLSFLYALLEGSRITSDSLSEEKREGTLGLLFLTDLRSYDIVLGKLAATSLRSFFGLLAIFPLLGIGLLGGGVTLGEFWRILLVLVNTLFFSVTVGLWMSAQSREDRRAWALSLVVLVLLSITPVLLAGTARLFFSRLHFIFGLASPLFGFISAWDAPYLSAPAIFWLNVAVVHSLAWSFLILACRILPESWQDRPQTKEPAPLVLPSASTATPNRAELLQANPVRWLATRHRRESSRLLWLFIGAAVSSGWGLQLLAGGSAALWVWSFSVNLILKIWLAAQACYSMAALRQQRALELLLVTPLGAEDIWRGFATALRRQFLLPFIVLQANLVGLFIFNSDEAAFGSPGPWGILVGFWGLTWSILTVVADLYALGAVGLWLGLRERRPAEAVAKTLLYVLAAPSLILCCVPRVLTDAAFLAWARMKLREEFRAQAIRQSDPTPADTGWWIFSNKRATV